MITEAISASLQHIALIQRREWRLALTREEAEEQMLHHIGCAYRSGEIDDQDLHAAYLAYGALGTPRKSHRWDNNVDIPWNSMHHLLRFTPNGPEGTWIGTWPIDKAGPVPREGTSVVYVLFDGQNEPCYVGSTQSFRPRLIWHAKDGKEFVQWQAYPCRDREHAYELEVRLLRERLPRLNSKVGR